MLQNPARPSGNFQLPYTTADMAERLAKKKAAKDRQDILDSFSGGLSYGKGGVDITPQLSQIGGMVKGLIQMPAATVMDIVSGIVRPLDKYVGGVKDPVDQYRPEDYGTSNLITGTAQGLEQATRRAVGDITAIPRVGKPSASPTATDIKRLGVIEGLSKAGIDYGNLALTAAPFVKPSAFGISNAYQDMVQARIARQNRSPFPTVKTPGAFIDVDALQGSRLPARIVDTPATPATRLAEAQTQRALPPAPTPEMIAQLQREAARTELGVNIQDIDFPPKGNELTRPMIVDSSDYGVFPKDAWEILGLAQHNAGVNNATMPKEMDALRTYFSNNYGAFQDILRDPTRVKLLIPELINEIPNQIKLIDNIFKVTSPTTENFQVFRGVSAESELPNSEYIGAFYRSLKEGEFMVEPAYLSTSINRDLAESWASDHADGYLLTIHVPKGSVAVNPVVSWERGLDEIGLHKNAPLEKELLFNRGSVLKIISNDYGSRHITAEIVPNYTGSSQPISAGNLKQSLLKKYSYKDLAEMVTEESNKNYFYVTYLETLPDVQNLLNKTRQYAYGSIDLGTTVASMNQDWFEYHVVTDYWELSDVVKQMTLKPSGHLADMSTQISAGENLVSLLKKYDLVDTKTINFIELNLNKILDLPHPLKQKPNP